MSAPTDANQSPANSIFRRILPTAPTGAKTLKFEPARKYREEEELMDEVGDVWCINGIDLTYEYDIELGVTASTFTEPLPLSSLAFTVPTGANALPYPGAVSTTITVVVRGEVKHVGNAGQAAKLAFKGWSNTNIA